MLIWLIGLLLGVERFAKSWLICRFFQQAEKLPPTTRRKVSILQPILSGDPTLRHTLAANLLRQSEFEREFLWLVDTNDSEGIAVTQALIASYPQTTIRLRLYPPPVNGVNPKMFKLIAAMKEATGELIAVLDDDTMLPDHAWEQCVPVLDEPGVGLAFGLPYYVNFGNLWSSLVSSFVNTFSLLTYVPYTFFRQPLTINGMFYVMKRETLEAIGGFTGLESQLCDDYAVAAHFQRHGLRLVQTSLRHAISTTVTDWRHYLRLMTRWLIFPQVSVMRRTTIADQLAFYLFAFVPTFVPLIVLAALILAPSTNLFVLMLTYLSVNGWIAWRLNRTYLNDATPPRALPLLLLIQFLLPLHTLWALIAPRRINWRGHVMRVKRDGGFAFVERRGDKVKG